MSEFKGGSKVVLKPIEILKNEYKLRDIGFHASIKKFLEERIGKSYTIITIEDFSMYPITARDTDGVTEYFRTFELELELQTLDLSEVY